MTLWPSALATTSGGRQPPAGRAALARRCHTLQARHADEEAQALHRHEPRGGNGGCAGRGRALEREFGLPYGEDDDQEDGSLGGNVPMDDMEHALHVLRAVSFVADRPASNPFLIPESPAVPEAAQEQPDTDPEPVYLNVQYPGGNLVDTCAIMDLTTGAGTWAAVALDQGLPYFGC